MRNRIFLVITMFAVALILSMNSLTIADEIEEPKIPEDFKLREYLPSTAPLYVEINKPFEFIKELATWDYLNTVLKLNLMSEEVPYIGNMYNMLETVRILGKAMKKAHNKKEKETEKIEIIRSLEIGMSRLNLMAVMNMDFTSEIVALIKVHEFADVASQLILLFQAQIEELKVVTVEEYQEFPLIELNANETKVYISMLPNGHILVALNKITLQKLVDTILTGKMKKSLADSETYKSAIQGLLEKKALKTEEKSIPQIKIYAYLKQMFQLLSFTMQQGAQTETDSINPFDLGIMDIHALCLNLYFENEKMHECLNFVVPENRKGIFGFFPTEPCKFDFARFAPENVSSIYFDQTDVMRVFTQTMNLLTKLQPEIAPYIQNFVDGSYTFGYNLVEEAFKSMNGEFCWWSFYDEKGNLAEATYLIESKEKKHCEYLIKELITNLSMDYFTSVDETEYKDVHINIFGFEQGLKDTVLQIPYDLPAELQEPVTELIESRFYDKLYIAYHSGKLILTTSENRMKTIIDNPDGIENSLAQNKNFKNKAEKLKNDQASSLLYFGDETFVYGWYDIVQTLFKQLVQETGELKLEIPSKKVFADSFEPFSPINIKGTKNTVQIRTSGFLTGTAITFASFVLKSALKEEITKQIKELSMKMHKK